MTFNNLTVRAKLSWAFGILTILVLIVSGLSLKAIGDANDRFSSYVNGLNARATMAESVRTAIDRRAIAARNLVLVTREADLEVEKTAVSKADEDVKSRLQKFDEMIATNPDISGKAKALAASIDHVEAAYGPVARAIVSLALEHKHDEAIVKLNDECRPLLAALIKASEEYADYTATRAAQMIEEAGDDYRSERNLLITMCVVALVAAATAGVLITRSLTNALGAEPSVLGEISDRVSKGDLSMVVGADTAPKGSVLSSMGKMQGSLVALISQVRTAADSIATGSSQIAAGNVDLSSRTEEQASALQETASSMEELTSTVKQNAENAQQASTLAANASEIAEKGNAVVGQVVDTMVDITGSSAKIADITGIIEGIAFQTNILALNAAVEAARAGEQGRGFAVVASEVRSLAQRSSSAAKEIKDLITSSVQKIKDGSALATQAGTTMASVTHAVARVTDIMGEIAAASAEQSRGIEQVNLAITQMDEVTQQNAALVEEAAAASQSLETQGQHLNQAVALFQLTEHSSSHHSVSTQTIARRKAGAPHAKAPVVSVSGKAIALATAGSPSAWETF
jgi:methyl-accepting chemotaxis protein